MDSNRFTVVELELDDVLLGNLWIIPTFVGHELEATRAEVLKMCRESTAWPAHASRIARMNPLKLT